MRRCVNDSSFYSRLVILSPLSSTLPDNLVGSKEFLFAGKPYETPLSIFSDRRVISRSKAVIFKPRVSHCLCMPSKCSFVWALWVSILSSFLMMRSFKAPASSRASNSYERRRESSESIFLNSSLVIKDKTWEFNFETSFFKLWPSKLSNSLRRRDNCSATSESFAVSLVYLASRSSRRATSNSVKESLLPPPTLPILSSRSAMRASSSLVSALLRPPPRLAKADGSKLVLPDLFWESW